MLTIETGDGEDIITVEGEIKSLKAGGGEDVITVEGKLGGNDWDTRGQWRLWGGDGDDVITLKGGSNRVNASGHSWDAFVEGGDGDDKIYLRGADKIYGGVLGGDGDDYIDANQAADAGILDGQYLSPIHI